MKERIRELPMGEKPQEELELSSLEEQLAKTRKQLLIYATDLARTFAADRRKKRELEEEHKRLTALYEVSRTLNSVLDLEGVLSLAMDAVLEVTGAERGFAMLLDPKSGEWVPSLTRQIDREEIESPSFRAIRGAIEKVIATYILVVTINAQADRDLAAQTNGIGDSPRSILCVPLVIREQLTGVIYVDNRIEKGTFTEQDLDFLMAFADQAAIAIENARLYENVTARMREAMTLEETRFLCEQILSEGIRVAKKLGYDYGDDFFENCLGYLDNAGDHKPSTSLDLEAGNPIEYIFQPIIDYGKKVKSPTPVLESLTKVMRILEHKKREKKLTR